MENWEFVEKNAVYKKKIFAYVLWVLVQEGILSVNKL